MTVHDFLDFALAVFAAIGFATVALVSMTLWYGIRIFREMDRAGHPVDFCSVSISDAE